MLSNTRIIVLCTGVMGAAWHPLKVLGSTAKSVPTLTSARAASTRASLTIMPLSVLMTMGRVQSMWALLAPEKRPSSKLVKI